MRTLIVLLLLLGLILLGLFAYTRYQAEEIEQRYPPIGSVIEIGGREMHFVDVSESASADLPPLMFVHGASGNLRDQMGAFREPLEGRARLLFIDRPGHGYSSRIEEDDTLAGQAGAYAALLNELEIEKVIMVCHSMGCASTAAMAVLHPEKVAGLVFLAPATHPWPGGIAWYYNLAAMPFVGRLFTETVSLPVGLLQLSRGLESVFSPQPVPDNYAEDTATPLVFRPHHFRANSRDVSRLNGEVKGLQPRYSEIKVPAIVITGTKDDVVAPEIHSIGLEQDIAGAELIILDNVGHKPDYTNTDTAISAIERVAEKLK